MGTDGPLPGMPEIPGVPNIPGMGGNKPKKPTPTSRAPAKPRPKAVDLDSHRRKLGDEISAYPSTTTYVDLIRRNKRESVLLIGAMLVVMALLFGSIFALVGGSRSEGVILPAAITGVVAGLLFAGLGATWSWFGGAGAILAMSGAKQLTKEQDPELFNVVDEMRIAAGLPMPKIYMIEDSAMNAFATGRDPEHGVVAITRGLRDKLTRDELQGVMAHEMAHIRHYDIRFALLMATMVGLIVFAADVFLRMLFYSRVGSSRSSNKGGGAAMIILVVATIVLAILAPILARMIQMTYSRRREFMADAGAVELTRNPEGLASALAKLADDPEPLVEVANRGTAHMYITNPLKKARASHGQKDSVFSSHPPIRKRIAALLALLR